jgi:hypothetical protein
MKLDEPPDVEFSSISRTICQCSLRKLRVRLLPELAKTVECNFAIWFFMPVALTAYVPAEPGRFKASFVWTGRWWEQSRGLTRNRKRRVLPMLRKRWEEGWTSSIIM